ncbi:hypothetical protein [Lentzea atacamensis]|uniref:hypothetical protein n=1 Tax=Lentzea atacamensis TaxID=531938 RepID=UPI000DD481F0|nr:hypothetical protein [Lentzea atacamensis]
MFRSGHVAPTGGSGRRRRPLNPYLAKPTRRPAGYTTHRIRPAGFSRPLRVWLDPSHGPWLLSLAVAADADLVWATTWEQEANEFIGPRLGLPELEWIDFGGRGADHRDGHHGKVPAITEWAGTRPIAWLDDEFQPRRRVGGCPAGHAARAGRPAQGHRHRTPGAGPHVPHPR